MAETEKKVAYSSIPMRTWRWLGINTAYLPEHIPETTPIENVKNIKVEPGQTANVTVVYRDEQRAEIHADVGDGATLNLIKVQIVGSDMNHVDSFDVKAGKEAHVNYTAVEVGGATTEAKFNIDLAGDNSSADVWALYFGDKDRSIDLNYVITQRGKNTDANMQVRGALKDKSQKIFRGTLDFLEGTKGSVGRENEEAILLNEGVRNRSVPIMLSHGEEVDGHHAVSIGKMDEEKLFYLMSRGLNLAEAQRLVVDASFAPVLDRITDESLRTEVSDYLKGRISDGE